MSDYHLVSNLHRTRVTLADARKTGDAAAVAAAEADVAAARAAVDAALADGRVTSAAHLLDLDLDCLGAILSHLGPEFALAMARTCTTLRSALFRGGLPVPLALICRKQWWSYGDTAAATAAALRALDGMEPALGPLWLQFHFESLDEDRARVLACALDEAPRTSMIDIILHGRDGGPHLAIDEAGAGRLADILSSPDRAFETAPQVHLEDYDMDHVGALRRLTRAGICIAYIKEYSGVNQDVISAEIASNTLTRLHLRPIDTVNLTTRFPALRKLNLSVVNPKDFTTNMPSLTALAPLLKEIEFNYAYYPTHGGAQCLLVPPKHGFGFGPRRFARFLAAIQGVTRVRFGPELLATLSQNENENLRQLTALRTLRDLEIAWEQTFVALENEDPLPLASYGGYSNLGPRYRAPVVDEVVAILPPLPGLTRLSCSLAARMAFVHQLAELRVLDLRDLRVHVDCATFSPDHGHGNLAHVHLRVPLAIPPAVLAPNLHTLLIGYSFWHQEWEQRGAFDLWTLVAARTALRVVVIENARLLCSAPDGFDTTTAGFAALLARDAKDLVAVHTHGCEIEDGHEPALENFLRALEERGVRVCRDGIEECMFCPLHDKFDNWVSGTEAQIAPQ